MTVDPSSAQGATTGGPIGARTPIAPPPVAGLVPHAGPMCLLDRVLDWDADQIRCEATVSGPHPLKIGARLPATALIEYAAQAMAAHGRLLALAPADEGVGDRPDGERPEGGGPDRIDGSDGGLPTPGRLVGLRATDLNCRWVDHERLLVHVRRLGGDSTNVLYGFEVFGSDAMTAPAEVGAAPSHPATASEGVALASGRAFVTLEPPR